MKYKKTTIVLTAVAVIFATMLCLYSLKLSTETIAAFGPTRESLELTTENIGETGSDSSDGSDTEFKPHIRKHRPPRKNPQNPIGNPDTESF